MLPIMRREIELYKNAPGKRNIRRCIEFNGQLPVISSSTRISGSYIGLSLSEFVVDMPCSPKYTREILACTHQSQE
jgi:hypothetical protein